MNSVVFLPGFAEQGQQLRDSPSEFMRLIAGANCRAHQFDLFAEIMHHCGMQIAAQLPFAALTAQLDQLPAGYYLRADPVHLQIDIGQIYMGGQFALVLPAELEVIADAINKVLAPYDMQILMPSPLRWYIRLTKLPLLNTYHHQALIGKSIRSYLPTGQNAQFWLQVFTEIQMVLYQLANSYTIMPAQSLANAVWLFGASQYPLTIPSSDVGPLTIMSDIDFVKGVAKLMQHDFYQLEFNNFINIMGKVDGKIVIASKYFLQGDVGSDIQWFDQNFFGPLLNYFQHNKQTLTLYDELNCYTIETSKLKRIWHKLIKFKGT